MVPERWNRSAHQLLGVIHMRCRFPPAERSPQMVRPRCSSPAFAFAASCPAVQQGAWASQHSDLAAHLLGQGQAQGGSQGHGQGQEHGRYSSVPVPLPVMLLSPFVALLFYDHPPIRERLAMAD